MRIISFASFADANLGSDRKQICFQSSGDREIRTLDPLLARQVLSQLSYAPIESGSHLLSHTVSSIVPSAA